MDNPTRTILALDAANKTGWAIVPVSANPTPESWGTIGGSTDKARRRGIRKRFFEVEAKYARGNGDKVLVYIEDQHVQRGPGGIITPESLRAVWKLRLIMGWFEMACEEYVWPFEAVAVKDWRKAMYGKQWTKGAGRAKYKTLAVFMVRAMFPRITFTGLTHDEAEAILIGCYGAKREWLKDRGMK